MPRRTKAAIKAGQPASAHPTDFRGRNDRGAVRPSDARYLEDAELDERDAYLLEVTGPDAQQLVVKRQELRAALDQLDDEDLVTVGQQQVPDSITGEGVPLYGRRQLLDALADQANTMPWADYRTLLEAVQDRVDNPPDLDASPVEEPPVTEPPSTPAVP